MDILEKIKSHLTIEQLVSQYVQLKPAGRNLKGLCPFHQEKTASFIVSPEKQIAWCFGCQKGGDIFGFIQEIESCDFKEAIKILGDKAGVDVHSAEFNQVKSAYITKDKKEVLYKIHEEAEKFYIQQLWDTEKGQKVLNYVRSRGIEDEFIKFFSLGFAPDSFEALYDFLISRNFQKKDLIDSGLISAKDTQSNNVYDKFRLRLMFPITDINAKIVAFGGRALSKDQEPKYLNSPETDIYYKGKILYGLNLVKNEIKLKNEVVLVEGYMDLIASYQAGVKNVVATSGTALTDNQLKILKRLTNNLVLCFDSDVAGQNAVYRAISLAQNFDFNIFIVTVPGVKDPGEYAVKNKSNFVELIKTKTLYIDFYLQSIQQEFDLSNMKGNKLAQDKIIPIIAGIKDPWEKESIVTKSALILRMSKKHLTGKVDSFSQSMRYHHHKIDDQNVVLNTKANDEAFGYILAFCELFSAKIPDFLEIIKKIPNLDLNDISKGIYNKIIEYYNSGAPVHQIINFSFLDREQTQYIKVLQLKFGDNFTNSQKEKIFNDAISKLKDRINFKERLDIKSTKDFSSPEALEYYKLKFLKKD
ncbi:MAG: primase, DNA primase protein [Candidatus Peregrinibacteria bacterium GW2011_GWF2_33_10]|nr:MAG: primase, DNA primase protein [Candidatus Peregrinibacteria bacterium GW2011_GWF2_33_10]OGJ44253.1 MAG: DNA primase [Candidatus Peregrinibacteria bacterium RIFOXYA12_FULL_33_12]OGJ44911.1 MAG: DNA primase [Candidatus Peregrinibacteria bacterium RIFOXYA2_FULL_33_21]OGJ50670.1 MAG: DNA primase [Candidatus Peregrinibacteria bacterium RIFOXYB2_FULL_33_20]